MAGSILSTANLADGGSYTKHASADLVVIAFGAITDNNTARTISSITLDGQAMTVAVNNQRHTGSVYTYAVVAWIAASAVSSSSTFDVTWTGTSMTVQGDGVGYSLGLGETVNPVFDTGEVTYTSNTTSWSVGYDTAADGVSIGFLYQDNQGGQSPDTGWTEYRDSLTAGSMRAYSAAKTTASAAADTWDQTPFSGTKGGMVVVAFTDAAGPILTNVDAGTNLLYTGETGIAYLGANLSNSTDVLQLTDGTYTVPCATTESSTTAGTFNVDEDNGSGQAIPLSENAAGTQLDDGTDTDITLFANITDSTDTSSNVSIELRPATGSDVVVASAAIGTGSTSAWQGLNFTPVKGDQIQFKTTTEDDLSVGYTGTVTIAADGTPTIDYGVNAVPDSDSFLCRYFDASEPAWTADSTTSNWASIVLSSGAVAESVLGMTRSITTNITSAITS